MTKKTLGNGVNRFRTLAWFNAVCHDVGETSPFRLEKLLQPWNTKKNADKKFVCSRAWDRYKKGERLPDDGFGKDGRPLAVQSAFQYSPTSLWLYRHPLWEAMSSATMSLAHASELISDFPASVARYYGNLSTVDVANRPAVLAENISLDIWVEREDWYDATYHLAAHLMFLRIEGLSALEERRAKCSNNISKCLGPLAVSPWFCNFYPEMFDWLELNVWTNIFDAHYDHGSNNIQGWRGTERFWLASWEDEILDDFDEQV